MTTVVQNIETTTVVVGGIMGPPGISGGSVSASVDVDITNLQNGSVLVYSTNNAKWQATQLLENQTINAGFF